MWVICVRWSRVERGTCHWVLFYKGLGHVEHVERIMWRTWNRDAPSTMMSQETYKSNKFSFLNRIIVHHVNPHAPLPSPCPLPSCSPLTSIGTTTLVYAHGIVADRGLARLGVRS
jgi:hypothetical protein